MTLLTDFASEVLGARVVAERRPPGERWERSGLLRLTGRPEAPPLASPAALADRLADVAATIAALGGPVVDGPALAAGRAGTNDLRRQGRVSCGGSCRMVATADGWLAVNLPRPSDLALVPAWLEDGDREHDWATVVADRPSAELIERAVVLGLAVARPGECASRPIVRRPLGPWREGPPRSPAGLRVVDLTSMWAGPLCAHLLGLAGAEVVKVEDPRRPDGARLGPPAFFELLHDGHEQVVADLDGPEVSELLRSADVVLESARPRALPQLGIDRDAISADRGCVWTTISGYGLGGGNRAAFGDDAAVAGGLVAWDSSEPLFCADAFADPVTGLLATVGTLAALAAGGPWVVDAGLAPCAFELADAAT